MKVRFLADADLNNAIVSGVLRREPSIDFLTAHAAGLGRMKDPEILALAAAQQRALVSHDVGTMPAHFREFRNDAKHSAGVASTLIWRRVFTIVANSAALHCQPLCKAIGLPARHHHDILNPNASRASPQPSRDPSP